MTELKKLTIGRRRPVGAALAATAGPLKPLSRAPAVTCGRARLREVVEAGADAQGGLGGLQPPLKQIFTLKTL